MVDMMATVDEMILIARDRREILFAVSIVMETLATSSNTKNTTAAAAKVKCIKYYYSSRHKLYHDCVS